MGGASVIHLNILTYQLCPHLLLRLASHNDTIVQCLVRIVIALRVAIRAISPGTGGIVKEICQKIDLDCIPLVKN